jgi:hypothetical protein
MSYAFEGIHLGIDTDRSTTITMLKLCPPGCGKKIVLCNMESMLNHEVGQNIVRMSCQRIQRVR